MSIVVTVPAIWTLFSIGARVYSGPRSDRGPDEAPRRVALRRGVTGSAGASVERFEDPGQAAGVPEHDALPVPRPGTDRSRPGRPAPWPCRSGRSETPSVRARSADASAAAGARMAVPVAELVLVKSIPRPASARSGRGRFPVGQRLQVASIDAITGRSAAADLATTTPATRVRGERSAGAGGDQPRPASRPSPIGTTTDVQVADPGAGEPGRRPETGQIPALRTERSRTPDADHVRPPASRPDGGRDPLDLGLPIVPIGRRQLVDGRPERLHQPDAGARAGRPAARTGRARRQGRRVAPAAAVRRAVVRPVPPARDQRIDAVGDRRPDQELAVAQLVAAEGHRQQIYS